MRLSILILPMTLALIGPGEDRFNGNERPSSETLAHPVIQVPGNAPREPRAPQGGENHPSAQPSLQPIFKAPSQWITYEESNVIWGGNYLSRAGDINGDGYDDLVVGHPAYQNDYESQGAVIVFFGSETGLSATPNWIAEGLHLDAWAGFVGAGGDVNADGFNDILVGAPPFYYDGMAFLYPGSATGPSAAPSWWNIGPDRKRYLGYRYGSSVTTEGDVNGDGYDDLIVGSELSTYDGHYLAGSINVYLGSSIAPSLIPDWTADGNSNELLGSNLAIAGDVNGDGFDDIIAGASYSTYPEHGEGRAYLYLGSAAGPSRDPVWHFEPNQQWSSLGYSVDSAGDVNGDGFDDIIVGAPGFDADAIGERAINRGQQGRACVFFGSLAGPSTTPSWITDGETAESWHGRLVRSVGDVNGDSFDDVLVMSYNKALIYFGSPEGPAAKPSWAIGPVLGYDVVMAASGDFNGDGIDDVVVNVPGMAALAVYFGFRCAGPRAPELPGNFIDENCDADLGACDPCGAWESHGRYVSCVHREVMKLVATGAISRRDGAALSAEAARSDIGKKEYVPPECGPFQGCGNGIREGAEVCDGADLVGESCASLRVGPGLLACKSNCRGFEFSGCVRCGDAVIDPAEACDGSNTGGATCGSLGYDTGAIICQNDCSALDLRGCSSQCGDGERDGGEVCDGADLDGETCESLGFAGGTLTCHAGRCDSLITTGCQTTCGDGLRGADEQCDGEDFGGKRCQEYEFHKGGTLRCRPDCTVDTSECFFCGDGVIEGPEECEKNVPLTSCQDLGFDGGEVSCNACERIDVSKCWTCGDRARNDLEPCEGSDLGKQTCLSQGFDGGALSCSPTCGFDVSECAAVCGNGDKGGLEVCDTNDVDGLTCRDMGFTGGVLGCSAECDRLDMSNCCCKSQTLGCPACPGCGNGVSEGPLELCDGMDLGAATCESIGRGGGPLGCNATCDAYDVSRCETGCGNDSVDGEEVCDGRDLDGQYCRRLGFDDGDLRCRADCGGFDTARCCCTDGRPGCPACPLVPGCGDGIRRPGELCDGHDVGVFTCFGEGFDLGTLTCNSTCNQLDTSGCSTICGNGERRGEEVCDSGPPPGWTCRNIGYDGGVLECGPACDAVDVSGCCCTDGRPGCPACPACGNGVRDVPFETCDGADLGGQTCSTQGQLPGTLACDVTCDGFDYSGCTGF